MEAERIAALGTDRGVEALAAATEQRDPSSLAAAAALRSRFEPELAAAALTQASLRRKAMTKFADTAGSMLFTPTGLEQASRPEVSAHRARRLADQGITRVLDLGCGIGADALAFVRAGLEIVAIELDPATAAVAEFNLAGRGQVLTGDVEELAPRLLELDATAAVFCDPARRDGKGRLWNVEQFSPSWSFVQSLLAAPRPSCVKLGPALPHSLIPEGVEAEWVSHNSDVVEVALWSGAGSQPEARAAVLLPSGDRLVRNGPAGHIELSAPKAYLYEPNGAVIRAGVMSMIAADLDACVIDRQIAYLTSDKLTRTPFATVFAVMEVLPYKEKVLKAWIRDHDIGELEIKKRGIDVDPAMLRKKLKPSGSSKATLILTRTPKGAIVLVVRRV